MKKIILLSLIAFAFGSKEVQAQTVTFSTSDAGKSLPVNWGMDTAWDDLYNVRWGITHYGANFQTGRISFQPYELVNESQINNASANFGLPTKMARKLQQRIDRIKLTGTTKVNINCDHEVLTRKLDDNGNYGDVEDNVGVGNYRSTPALKTAAWVNLIKACVKYAQAQGLEVVSVSPFNEPDYGWNQYNNATPGRADENHGMQAFKAIAQAIKADAFFASGAGRNVRICGGNTLNCDRASAWYESLKPYVDEGNTHQLAGSFDNYASFFQKVRNDGKIATADELHNVGEAIAGVQYGMQNGIWWGFDSKARGQFMHDSNEGKRIGYAENRSQWTAAAVYRNEKDNEIHGFIGSSERQANTSTYKFQCTDREVYFNGYGPQREWQVTTKGGTGYQRGQINYEYLFDITYGEDVQSFAVDGNYQIMSASDRRLITSNGYWNGNNHLSANTQANNNTQRWHIYPDNEKKKGDCSYWFIDNVGDATQHFNLLDRGGTTTLDEGARIICYNASHDALEQWYFRYAKDGYFYIIARQNNKYIYNNNGTLSLREGPTSSTSATELKKFMWRLMPTDATAETTAPATPSGLKVDKIQSTGVTLSWNAVTGEAKAVTYNILRQDASGWNTIARCQSGTTYTDTKAVANRMYNYKVQTVDYSGNRSAASSAIYVDTSSTSGGGVDSGVKDFTNYITNPTILQYGTTNDAPEGWSGASTNVTGNGHWTEGTGDTRLEAWHWTNAINADYYQDVLVPNGLYTLTAVTHQRNDGNAALYGETVGIIESSTKMPVGDNNEATTTVQNILVTDGILRIGVKVSNTADGNWMTADNFTLTRVSTPAETALSHYTDAIAYLMREAETEMARNAGFTELVTAYNAARTCAANTTAYETAINNLAAAILKSRAMPPTNTGGVDPNDFTYLITNPTIFQGGTTNDAPEGWEGASSNTTGNGHWTEGAGDTRLEAWHWTNEIKADYYQDIELPNGLYTIAATTHQRNDGNAALYGETLSLLEASTKMPVGDNNDAEIRVENVLVTDGTLRIGVKVSGTPDGNWMTADNFKLTLVSTPAETALTNYTNTITQLMSIADDEMERNPGFAELVVAYNAARSCAANVSAYETAINNLAAAILKSRAMGPVEPELPATWIGQTANYGSAAERYNGDEPYPAGRILYQVVENLVPGAQYEIQFYAVANLARNLDVSKYAGSGIAYLFANNLEIDIDVINQAGCTPSDYLRTITAVADENGQIAYGIANRKDGGQWYVAQAIGIRYLGLATAGDMDDNGKYTIRDVATAIKTILTRTADSPFPYKVDMDGNGIVNTLDIQKIADRVLEK